MTSYSGNPSLGDEVKQRIVGTFEQSLDLAERGRSQEALLGCDFILELDPEFAPARALKERLEAGGEPDVGDLRPGAAAGSGPEPEPPEESFGDLFDLDSLDLSDLEEPSGPTPPSPAPPPDPPQGGAPDGLAAELRRRLEAREYQGVLDRAGEDRERVAADPELASIVETAQARLEAQPYVESFLRKAGTALRSGDPEGAEQALAKARSLDPEHPLLEDLEAEARQAVGPAPAGARSTEEPAEPPAAPGEAEPASGLGDEDILGGYELPDLDAPPEPSPGAAPIEPAEGQPEPGDDRIAQLLAEGQRAADEGNLQEAIDAWSRIFLIDVDHEEAARRIEEARRQKAERERRVEEVFHEGLTSLEEGDTETARRRFDRVLEMQPGHLAARSYLDQLDSGEPARVPPAGPAGSETAAMGELGSFDLSSLPGPAEEEARSEALKEEILVPPPPGAAGADREREDGEAATPGTSPSYGKAVAGTEPGRRTFLLVGGLVLVLVLAVAALLYVEKDSLFPNSDVEEPAAEEPAAEPSPGPIERASELHERGQTAMALGLLRRIRPDDPRHGEAQELIARWEEPAEPEEEETAEALAPEVLERRDLLLAAAERAFEETEYLLASELYDRAGRIAELEGENLERAERVEGELAPLEPEIELFREGEYELVLPRLWRLYQEEPTDRDLQRMIVASYYNRGVRQLQRGDPAGAAAEFEEALALAPDDRDLQRHYLFAQTYQRRPRDLLYRTYVKYLPLR